METTEHLGSQYSDDSFARKLRRSARAVGGRIVESALILYYAAQSPDTPQWARAVIYGALGYFILPTDAIPDLVPGVGYTDDLGVIAMALATIASRITPQMRAQAAKKRQDWFE